MTVPMREGIHPLVWRLLRPYQDIVGPMTYVMRLAFWTKVANREFDADATIARHADYLNRPEHAEARERLVSTCGWIIEHTPEPPLWVLPDVVFDPSQWLIDVPEPGRPT